MSMLTLKLPKELERELHRAAVTRGVSKSQLAREAIASYIRRPPSGDEHFVSALDLAGDLVGSIKRSPRGLTTNPKFMDDFGKD
jgi:predicted DNA-binding protein